MKVEFYLSQRISSNNILLSYSPKKSHPKRNDGGADTSMLEAQVSAVVFSVPFVARIEMKIK
jgi:hypothetical protein